MARKTRPPLTKSRQTYAEQRGGHTYYGSPLHYSAAVESRYQRELTLMVRQMRIATETAFRRLDRQFATDAVATDSGGVALDAPSYASQARILTDALRKRFMAAFSRRSRPAAERMQRQVDAASSASLHQSLKELSGGVSLSTRTIPKPAIEILKAGVAENVALIRSIPDQYFLKIQGEVMRNIQRGDGSAGVLAAIEHIGVVTTKRAELIARDQTSKATTNLNAARMKGLGIRKFEWLHSSGGKEPRKLHVEMSGNIYSLDDPPVIDDNTGERGLPGQLINCFPGSTQVSLANGCRNLWRYWHSGEIVRIGVEGDSFVECTPNHPVLTGRGWLSAHEIQEGDYLVAREPENVDAVDHEDAKYVTFADLYVALAASEGSETAPGTEFNFHGDVPPQDVDSIRTVQFLSLAAGEQCRQLGLASPDGRSGVIGFSGGGEVVHPLGASTGGQSDAVRSGEGAHARAIGAAAVSQDHALLPQNVRDDISRAAVTGREGEYALPSGVTGLDGEAVGAGDLGGSGVVTVNATSGQGGAQAARTAPETLGDGGDAFAGTHRLLRVLEKGIRIFAGHVYTMETNVGWYEVTPAMIVSKNCRCVMRPVLEFGEE